MGFLQLVSFWAISRLPLSFSPATYKNSRNTHLRGTGFFFLCWCLFKNTIPPNLPLHRIPCKPGFHQALEEETTARSAKAGAAVAEHLRLHSRRRWRDRRLLARLSRTCLSLQRGSTRGLLSGWDDSCPPSPNSTVLTRDLTRRSSLTFP